MIRITGTGHAGMLIETPAGRILCDPWVNPAYFASWFPFPDNSGLDWDRLGACDYLYVSHLHRDHFDAGHLRAHVSKQATVLLPEYPTRDLEDELREIGFTSFVRTRTNEPVTLDGGLAVMIQALVSPTDGPIGDSSLWVQYDGVRLLNQNDARPRDLSAFAALGRVHAHLLQFSGAIWYPMVYELPDAATRAFGKQKRERQLDRTLRYIDGWQVQKHCPHLKANLVRFGRVDEDVLTCQMHGWRFDLQTGRCLTSAGQTIRASRVRADGPAPTA